MLAVSIVLSILAAILLFGLANYTIRRRAAGKIALPWYNPNNIVDIGGVRTHVLIAGQGEPLLFIHGSQMNLYDWRFSVGFFSNYFKVYAVDMVGCGFSDKPKADYSPAYYAGFIKNVMDHYGIEKASFVSSSWGGGHVFHFALLYPQRVNKLVMSSPCGLPHKMNFMDAVLAIPIISNFVMLFITKGLIKKQLSMAFEKKELIDDKLVDSVYYPLLTKGTIFSTVTSYRNANFSFVKENMDKIACPVLIFWGTRDRIHARWMIDEMERRIPGSRVSIIEHAGHMPHEEASDDFNNGSLSFLYT